MSRYGLGPVAQEHKRYKMVASLIDELKKLGRQRTQVVRRIARIEDMRHSEQSETKRQAIEALMRRAVADLRSLDDRVAFLRRSLEEMGVRDV